MTQTARNYITREYQPGDEVGLLELMKLSLGESQTLQRTDALWKWKHLTSPFGPSYLQVACDKNGTPVGMRAFMPWKFRVEDRIIKAVRAVDTATHPDYRRLGIFSTLTKQAVEAVRDNGIELIFNTPNEYSLPGYLKMGWGHVATVQPLIKVLNYPSFALGMVRSQINKPRMRLYTSDEFFQGPPAPVASVLEMGPDVEELLRQEQEWRGQESGLRTHRTVEYLLWRYAQHPTIPYWAVVARHGEGLQGCAIFRTNTRYGMKEVVLSELILLRPREDVGYYLLDQLRASVRADYLITYFPEGSLHRRVLERWGFHAVPREGINFTVRSLVPDLSPEPSSLESWRLSMGDLEVF